MKAMGEGEFRGSQMLSRYRLSFPASLYFITTAKAETAGRIDRPDFFSIIIAELARMKSEGLLDCLALVLMPDHLHMIIRLGAKKSLSQTLKLFKGRTAYQLNRLTHASGSIWYPGFHDRMVRTPDSLAGYYFYARDNPVKAHFVATPADWPFLFIKDEMHELFEQ